MGLFDFFRRDAGPKAGGDTPTPEGLRQHLEQMGISTNGLDIGVNDDTVTVRGAVANKDQREKIAIALGNVHGVGKVEDQLGVSESKTTDAGGDAPVADSGPGERPSQFYTVEAGDTLSKIAKQFYGDANDFERIFEANRPMLSDPNKIYPGQVLRVPNNP